MKRPVLCGGEDAALRCAAERAQGVKRPVMCGGEDAAPRGAAERTRGVKRPVLCGGVLAAVLLQGCASQTIIERHYYEPADATLHEREDGLKVGAVKSETIKTGQPDWSGGKTFSLFSW